MDPACTKGPEDMLVMETVERKKRGGTWVALFCVYLYNCYRMRDNSLCYIKLDLITYADVSSVELPRNKGYVEGQYIFISKQNSMLNAKL